ncbi:MAG: hypothetical protein ACK4R6_14570, partial [Spirosomataceae bacterium]
GIVSEYSCGNHDTAPAYSGEIISVNAGDEVAMNTMIISIVDIDGSGNGSGLIKVPMMNNIKLGVTLSDIKVAEGGCVVAGKAELSGIDVAILNEKQRVNLEKAYTAYNQILDVAYQNAGAIAETYNSLTDLYEKTAQQTQLILDKVNDGKKISKAEQKALAEMKKKAKEGIDKQIAYFTKKFGSEGSDEIIKLVDLASQSCGCEAYTESLEPKNGPNQEVEAWIFYDDDCKKCLEEDKKRQQEMTKLAKVFEDKLRAIKDKKMECGCFKWGTILQDLGTDDKNCQELVEIMNNAKEDLTKNRSTDFQVKYLPFDTNKPIGQVSVGDICINNFSIKVFPNSATITVYSDKKTQYNEQAVEISGNTITFNDFQTPTEKSLIIKTDNNEQARFIEKWLFDGSNNNNSVNSSKSTKITIYRDKVSEDFLAKVETICSNLEIDPNYLMACMAFETGETFSPCVKNPGSSATGLIQFMSSTAKSLGTTTDDLCKMSAVEQLDYVSKYFQPYKGKIKTIADIYMVIFCPKGVGKEMDYTLYPPRQIDYDRNKGLDKDKDAIITKQEAYNAVKNKLEKGLK